MDICAYAIMSNHYHVVLRVDSARALAWTEATVIDRWCQLFSGPPLVTRMRSGIALTSAESDEISRLVETWRDRLSDISWFMRCLNEFIARRANEEDACSGCFWDGRFKCQALLDEAALLTCMSYVDLNPIRAGVAQTPEASEFTSIYERIRAMQNPSVEDSPTGLLSFVGHLEAKAVGIPFLFEDYLLLLDSVGRAIREDKRGAIPIHSAPILTRLKLAPNRWLDQLRFHGRFRRTAVGSRERIRQFSRQIGQSWVWGQVVG